MSSTEIPTFDGSQLDAALAEVLERWPLYRRLKYRGGGPITTVPQRISVHCTVCENDQIFQTRFYGGEDNRTGYSYKEYRCRNCDCNSVHFFLYWLPQSDKSVLFFKAGQFPELEERVPEALRKALRADLPLYKNALRLRNFNLGIGAVAYLRRIVENHMNDVLDNIFEAAQLVDPGGDATAELAQIKASRGFQDKIAFAEKLLPARLRPEGVPRPLAVLYDLTSDALHARSDDECIIIFDGCRRIFEYMFSQLHQENESARQFKADLALAPGLKPEKR